MKNNLIETIEHHKDIWDKTKCMELLEWAFEQLKTGTTESPLLTQEHHDEVEEHINFLYPE